VQADSIAKALDLFQGIREGLLSQRFTTTKNGRLQKSHTLLQKLTNNVPNDCSRPPEFPEVGVVTIPAVPWAALTKNHSGQLTGIIHGRERLNPANGELPNATVHAC
jgi:hypothetical protein